MVKAKLRKRAAVAAVPPAPAGKQGRGVELKRVLRKSEMTLHNISDFEVEVSVGKQKVRVPPRAKVTLNLPQVRAIRLDVSFRIDGAWRQVHSAVLPARPGKVFVPLKK